MSFKIILLFALIAVAFGQDYDDGGDGGYDGGEGGGYEGGDGGDGGYDGGDGGDGGYDGGESESEGGYTPNGGGNYNGQTAGDYGSAGQYTPGAEYQTQNLFSGFAPSLTSGLGYVYSPMASSNVPVKVAPSRRNENVKPLRQVRSPASSGIGPVMTYVKTDLTGNFKWGIKHLVETSD